MVAKSSPGVSTRADVEGVTEKLSEIVGNTDAFTDKGDRATDSLKNGTPASVENGETVGAADDVSDLDALGLWDGLAERDVDVDTEQEMLVDAVMKGVADSVAETIEDVPDEAAERNAVSDGNADGLAVLVVETVIDADGRSA